MKKSKDIIGTSASNFARIIAGKRGRHLIHEMAGRFIEAEVNHGRWIVRCPYCSGAELADVDDPVFMCLSCFNEGNAGRFHPVRFPEDHNQIEAELSKRGRIDNQNWIPGESLADLEKETEDNGRR